MFRRLILLRGETNLIDQVFLVGSLGSYGDGGGGGGGGEGTLLGRLYRSTMFGSFCLFKSRFKTQGWA